MSKFFKIAIILLPTFLLYLNNKNINFIETSLTFWANLNFILHGIFVILSFHEFKTKFVSFLFLIALFALIIYGISPFIIHVENFQLGTLNKEALQISFVGYSAFYVSYLFFRGKLGKEIQQGQTNNILPNKAFNKQLFSKIKFSFLLLYIVNFMVEIPINGLPTIIIYYTAGLFTIGFYLGINKIFENIILLVVLTTEVAKGITSSLIFSIIYFSIFLIVVVINSFRKSSINNLVTSLLIIVFSVFVILFQNVKMQYRDLNLEDLSNLDKINVVQDLIASDITENINSAEVLLANEQEKGSIWRLSYSASALSLVILNTPLNVPYWNGESYIPIFTKWIPRFLWEDKPVENMGQEFGHRYRILNPLNFTTSMNTPVLAEAYMNYALEGVVGLMIILGFVVSKFYSVANNTYQNGIHFLSTIDGMLALLKVSFLAVIYCQWESNLSMMIGKIIILFIIDRLLTFYLKTTIGK